MYISFLCFFLCVYGGAIVLQVYGQSITDPMGMQSVRQITGICPQRDVLYPSLTVDEHLRFFAALKVCLLGHFCKCVSLVMEVSDANDKKDKSGVSDRLCREKVLFPSCPSAWLIKRNPAFPAHVHDRTHRVCLPK